MRQEILDLAAQHNIRIELRADMGWDSSHVVSPDNPRVVVGLSSPRQAALKRLNIRTTERVPELIALHEMGHIAAKALYWWESSHQEILDCEGRAWKWAIAQRGGFSRLNKTERQLMHAAMFTYHRDHAKPFDIYVESFHALFNKVKASLGL